jgi:hypothetical protein
LGVALAALLGLAVYHLPEPQAAGGAAAPTFPTRLVGPNNGFDLANASIPREQISSGGH